jgi:hypothetical protein
MVVAAWQAGLRIAKSFADGGARNGHAAVTAAHGGGPGRNSPVTAASARSPAGVFSSYLGISGVVESPGAVQTQSFGILGSYGSG